VNDTDPRDSQADESAPEGREPDENREGPGRRLREAREAEHLTLEDVAAQLHLDVRMVSALEEDDYDQMPAPAYVTGYLRNYARLLRLPEEEILEAYDREEEAPSLLPNIELKPAGRGAEGLMRWVTYLLIVALVVLLLLWWFGVDSGRKLPIPGDTTAPAAPANTAPGKSMPGPAAAPSQPTTPPAASIALGRTPLAGAVSGAGKSAPATSGSGAGANGAASGKRSASATGSAAAAASAMLGMALPQHLTLHYTDDSWTEVYDAAGRRLVYRLVKAGETLELTGEAPFDVTLGYAPAVTIKYNGQPFDKGRSNSKDVAHFVIGKSDAGAAAARPGDGAADASAAPGGGAQD